MNNFGDERGGVRYLAALRHHWLLIAVVVAAAVGAAALYSNTAEERYEAEADVLVTPIANDDPTFVGIPLIRESGESRAVLTVARLIESAGVAEGVRERLQSDISRGDLLDSIEVTPQEQSTIVTVVGKDSTGPGAARIANGFAEEVVAQRTEAFQGSLRAAVRRTRASLAAIPPEARATGQGATLQTQLDAQSSLVAAADPTVQVVSPAAAPSGPVWPRPTLSILVALMTGLLLGVGLAVALEQGSPRIKREDDLVLDQRLPILARIPQMKRRETSDFITGRAPLPVDVKEAYRTLRAGLLTAGRNGGMPAVVLVASAMPGDGKTMTSVNLATTLASAGRRVILIDGDLRRPMIASVLNVTPPSGGLVDLLLGRATPEDALQTVAGRPENLQLLLSNPEPFYVDNITPDLVSGVLDDLRTRADVIVIDSPALAEVSDALTFADVADVTVVAVRLGRTRRDKLHELRRMLAQRNVTPVGLVVTTRDRPRMYGYYRSPGATTDMPPAEEDGSRAPVGARNAGKR